MWTKNARQAALQFDGGTRAQGEKNPVLFRKHLVGKEGGVPDHKRGSVFEAISVKRSSQDTSTESASGMEREKKELYLVNNFYESGWGKNFCNLFVLH